MIGQTNLINKLSAYTIETLPKTILFLGEAGSGKKTITKWLADRFDLPVVLITADTTAEDLDEYRLCPVKKMYSIDLTQIDSKQQNIFLKFIEDPAKNNFIALQAETEFTVLSTVLNRCLKLHMEPYTKAELKYIRIYPDEKIYEVCRTPGQLMTVDYRTFTDLYKKTQAIVTISTANYANTLSVATLINYKEEYDKFDFDLFLRTFQYAAFEQYRDTNSVRALKIYQIVNRHCQQMVDKKLVKENLILNMLSEIWQQAR